MYRLYLIMYNQKIYDNYFLFDKGLKSIKKYCKNQALMLLLKHKVRSEK